MPQSSNQPADHHAAILEAASQRVNVGGEYFHYKQGVVYTVMSLGIIEATGEVAVIYRAKFGKVIFIRPLFSWLETVDFGGKSVLRFTPV